MESHGGPCANSELNIPLQNRSIGKLLGKARVLQLSDVEIGNELLELIVFSISLFELACMAATKSLGFVSIIPSGISLMRVVQLSMLRATFLRSAWLAFSTPCNVDLQSSWT